MDPLNIPYSLGFNAPNVTHTTLAPILCRFIILTTLYLFTIVKRCIGSPKG